MKKIIRRNIFVTVTLCAMIAGLFLSGGYCRAGETEAENLTLNVALYPLVPDMDGFKNAVTQSWAELHPEVSLNFTEWSCYDEDPPENLDVFVFDCLFLSEFIEKGYLLPVPEEMIPAADDLVTFAADGCRSDGVLYAVPQLLCTNLLYTRKDDEELSGVSDIETLYEILGNRISQSEIPGKNEGLLIDMTGGTTKVCMCLDAMMDYNQAYTEYEELPDPDGLPEDSLDALRLLVDMGGEEQVLYWPEDDELYVRGRWFSEGIGRAYIGFTEAMSAMGSYVDDIDFSLFSYASADNVPLFFADAAGINSSIEDSKKDLAYDLIDVLTCEDSMLSAICPDGDVDALQYLLPARTGIYERLSQTSQTYGKLETIVLNPDNRLFRLGADAREFIAQTKKILPDLVFAPEEISLAA